MANRLVLLGATGWGNIGDDVIADSILTAASRFDYETTVVGGPLPLTQPLTADRFLSSVDGIGGRLKIAAAILRADVVAIGGGGLLEDRDGKFYRPFLRSAKLGSLCGKKVVFVSVGVGPLRRAATREDFAKILSYSDIITVRDEASKGRLLQAATGSQAQKIEVFPDPALWPTSLAVGRPRQEPAFDLALNMRPWTPSLPDPGEDISSLPPLGDVADAIVTAICRTLAPGSRIAMVPMSELTTENDKALLESIAPRLCHYELSWPEAIDASHVCDMLERSRMLLTMRLHAMLIARAAGVPTVALSYDSKVAQQGEVVAAELLTLAEGTRPEAIEAAFASACELPAPAFDESDEFPAMMEKLFAPPT